MKKKHAQDLISLSDECPYCKNGKMKVDFDTWFDKSKVYYLRCNKCGETYDD